MLPNRSEWKSWSTLEKVTYLAQFAASLALLPTVVFAWLSFREARLAREDQVRYFQAEKAPIVELQSLEVRGGVIVGTVRNAGESKATQLRYWYTISHPPKKCNITVAVNAQETRVHVLERGQTAEFVLETSNDLIEKCGLRPNGFDLRLGRSYSVSDDPPYIELLLVWHDVQGEERAKKYEATVKQ